MNYGKYSNIGTDIQISAGIFKYQEGYLNIDLDISISGLTVKYPYSNIDI